MADRIRLTGPKTKAFEPNAQLTSGLRVLLLQARQAGPTQRRAGKRRPLQTGTAARDEFSLDSPPCL